MKNGIFVAVLFGVFAQGAFGQATRLDFSNRLIPFEVTSDSVLSGTLESRTIEPGLQLNARAEIPEEKSKEMFALLVPKAGQTTVTINGEIVTERPEDRRNSWVYPIFSSYLKSGENQVQIEREELAPWTGTRMFSLLDGFEEAHFPWAFGLPTPSDGGLTERDFAPSPLQENYDVLAYDSVWRPRIGSPYMEVGSQVTMTVRAVESLSAIDVDFDLGGYTGYQGSMVVDSVDNGPGTSQLLWQNLPDRNMPRMRITLARTYAPGEEFDVRIAYHGMPNRNFPKSIFGNRPSFYSQISDTYGVMIFSANQPYGARRWFPCKDHPSDKADFIRNKIIVANTNGPLMAVSNGNLVSQTVVGGNTEFVWEHNYPIAPYLMSLAVGNYHYEGGTYTSRDGTKQMPVGAYVYQPQWSHASAWTAHLEILTFFAEKLGEYPFIDEKYVTAAWGETFAIEHQTATSMPPRELSDPYARRNVHELAHHWFGNKVTTDNWDHTWLNEGFATYCEALFDEYRLGYGEFRSTVRGWSIQAGPIVSDDSDLFGGKVYRRAARVLDTLRFVLGDDAFFKALKDYAAQGFTTAISQPDPAHPDVIDFQTIVEESAGLAPGSMKQFFDQWLYAGGDIYADRPVFSHSVAYDIETSSVTFRLNQTQSGPDFVTPVEFRLTGQDSSTTSIIVPAGKSVHTVGLGEFVPTGFALDPDHWLLRYEGMRFQDISLPQGTAGLPYTYLVGVTDGGNNATVQKLPGTPTWLLVSSAGVLSGTPPEPGIYPVNLRVSGRGDIMDVRYKLVVQGGTPPPPTPDVVINEVAYESRSFTSTDFIELLNNEDEPVDISGWRVVLIDSGANAYQTVTIPNNTVLAAGDYYVIGSAAAIHSVFPGVVDLNTAWSNALTDFMGGVLLYTDTNARVDGLAYRADGNWGSGPYRQDILIAGGAGRLLSQGIANTAINNSLGRLPNGVDTGSNLRDFASVPASPGAANTGTVTLPFFDDFNTGIRPEWRPAFQVPLRTATPGDSGKPTKAPPAPAGGAVLEVFDETGGGDVNYLSGAFEQLNFEGYIWIPQNMPDGASWSTGVGINTRVDSAWFSASPGFEMPNGFYLEYQNGPGVRLGAGGAVPQAPGYARLLAADSSSSPGVGPASLQVTVLGAVQVSTPSEWYPFRMIYDRPGNRLMASLGDDVIYDGVIPEGGYNTSGGISIGFRESHGRPIAANREGTWVDNIRLDTDVDDGSSVEDFLLY